ncbi:MAG TPA: hypothetical protein H9815_14075 [Candidatus Ruania gallistercoris]|uniref:Uncharacterized protein n=1 Tax=Candidatus Ruania gallistercoris TaxID=2838746 RepID=A0A9D2EH04_9MICO|nr:hypothetical protein [Candidatus Ruania gallistercoris]
MRRSVRQLPDPVRARIPAKVRVLTVRRLADHAWAVVTTHRLLVLEEDRTVLDRPWAEVDRATMDSDTEELTVTWVDGSPPDVLLVGEDPGVSDFTFAVKERVDNSLVHLELEQLPGGGVLRGAIRRNPDGSLFSQVSVSGARRAPADLEERAAALEARVRSVVGLTP